MRTSLISTSIFAMCFSSHAGAETLLPVKPSPYLVSAITRNMFRLPKSDSDLILVSAHRGSWEVYPENSAYALQDAWNSQIEAVEVDARSTADKEIILSHDYRIERESTGSGLLYNQNYSQVQGANLRDRHGRVFKDPQGRVAKFLTFSAALDLLAQYITDDGHGYVMIVDVKAAVDDQDPTDPIELTQRCLDILAAKKNSQLSKAVVFKLKAKDAVDIGTFLNRTTYNPDLIGGLIIVENPDDDNVKDSSYDPHQDTVYDQWNVAPFPVQFEMNQFYKGDGLQAYFDYADQKQGFATYHESNYYPEGVANSAGKCCFGHNTDPTSTAPGGIVPDYRGDPEMAVVNRTNLITTDWPDVVGDMLREFGRRNTSELSR
ncbi:glycerophosphodiester phosphodiesterase family protein [Sinorhizobium sp. 8-89]|uniref:glycerophosphodiester phosphodiesterase family protein n=1 Tax=Sinorhizobium sp. 7-81 TaxID=3049087 RepID=UPI0024C23C6E|nr:glycerophosphodiester phosphodiesterase family protein [Sinorhizobium sp. 7-81]MDK1389930.1 glycerophosphodiester phosphodiesterase family protein [Sinorhizobium sp. 7-81]